jgi:hypothetical protein
MRAWTHVMKEYVKLRIIGDVMRERKDDEEAGEEK